MAVELTRIIFGPTGEGEVQTRTVKVRVALVHRRHQHALDGAQRVGDGVVHGCETGPRSHYLERVDDETVFPQRR